MADSVHPPLPPADFRFLVESVLMQAQLQLGLLSFGEPEGDSDPDLPMARHSIDLLGMIQEKTKGNLTTEEQRLLDNGLTELRFQFVQICDQVAGKAEGQRSPSPSLAESEPKGSPMIITPDGGKGSKTE